MATVAEVLRFHDAKYVQRVRRLSAGGGGDAGDGSTPIGHGSFEIALLAAGACIEAVDSVLDETTQRAYVLCRPPGHHASPSTGAGFCVFNNVVLAALHARSRGVQRLAIIDWDAHHGNGTQAAFWNDPEVLYVSIHQDGYYPHDTGSAGEVGGESAQGNTVNIPIPAGSGDGALLAAVDRLIVPILLRFQPRLILASSGLDASYYDPFSQLAITSAGFRELGTCISEAAETLECGLVCCHEGGYSEGYVPFALLGLLEGISGFRSQVEDPFLAGALRNPATLLHPHQMKALETVVSVQEQFWGSLGLVSTSNNS